MATSFDRWEKDPFFSAAEEVQESADRMESAYRTWAHSRKDGSSMSNSEELQRDLRTALGTTKWQLEEFERAVQSSYLKSSGDDARDRHRDFVIAIEDHISRIKKSLSEAATSNEEKSLYWVRLDEGERNELASFLSGDLATLPMWNKDGENPKMAKELSVDCLKRLSHPGGDNSSERTEGKAHGHRRTASAGADISSWNIAITEDGCPPDPSSIPAPRPPRKTPSLSGLLSSMESVSKLKWPKNGARKWKGADCLEESDAAPLQSLELTKGIKSCYESKSCMDSCDELYDKQLYGWYGAIQRQLQRSQYRVQYSRPVRVVVSVVLIFCLIVLLVFRAL